jgi:hypothetical protein
MRRFVYAIRSLSPTAILAARVPPLAAGLPTPAIFIELGHLAGEGAGKVVSLMA